MNLLLFVLKKFLRLLLTILIISTIIFFVIRVIPGDPALVVAGIDASDEEIQAIRAKLGTDVPVTVQYVRWMRDLVKLDLGKSLTSGQSVKSLIRQRFPLTFTLAVLGIILGVVIAIPLGVLSAVHRWSLWDYLGMVYSQAGMAIPSFWLGIILLLLFSVKFPLFPLFGSGSLKNLVLPAIALGFARAAVILRLTRASMVDELSKEYIITARAKGLTEKMINYKHAL
ncbi:MAG: ABC transporter permease, partial [Spirochaetes bacterium]